MVRVNDDTGRGGPDSTSPCDVGPLYDVTDRSRRYERSGLDFTVGRKVVYHGTDGSRRCEGSGVDFTT